MSGQWEVVGRKKTSDKAGARAPGQTVNRKDNNSKKAGQNVPKIEEVLPMSQVKNLYKPSKTNKENQKPQEKSKQAENGVKKAVKKQEKQPEKPKPPKSIESALNSIDVNAFKDVYENSKAHFPDAPVVWLKDLMQYLNQKVALEVTDPVFASKPEGYPFCMVPPGLKSVIERGVKEAGKNNVQVFFDGSLTSMAMDMSKGCPALGCKLLLQYVASSEPKVVAANFQKYYVLRNSYQNRQAIGLSILWVLGQSGLEDFQIGYKVFQEMMLPLIEMKNYSRFVAKYFCDLIKRHSTKERGISITIDQFLTAMDVAYEERKNFPGDLGREMNAAVLNLKNSLLAQTGKEKKYGYVEALLRSAKNPSKNRQEMACGVIVNCFTEDPATLGSWTKNYVKNLPQSASLLNYMNDNWTRLSGKLNRKTLSDVLKTYTATNEELSLKRRKDEGLNDCDRAIKALNAKMAAKQGTGFPTKKILFFLAMIIAGLVYWDAKQSGGWENSKTNKALTDHGFYDYARKIGERTRQGIDCIDSYIEDNFPEFYGKAKVFFEPYVELTKDLSKVFCNALAQMKEKAVETYPLVLDSVNSYAPGLIEHSQKAVSNVWSASVLYYNRGVDYLKNEVFVGQLSPENMQRVVYEAINTTQQKATEYYHWLYEKVQTTIK